MRDCHGLRKELQSIREKHTVEMEEAEKRMNKLEQQLEQEKTTLEESHKAAGEVCHC